MRSIANVTEPSRSSYKVLVYYSDGTEVDLSDRLRSINYGIGQDEGDYHCSMTFNNQRRYVQNNLSLDPLDDLSALNKDSSNNYDPLLSNNHRVVVKHKKVNGNWNIVFEGQAGHGTDSARLINMQEDVQFDPYGLSQVWKGYARKKKINYKDRDLATSLLRSILIDSGYDQGRMSHIVIENDPAHQVTGYATPIKKLWKVLAKPITEIGYNLQMRYQPVGTAYNDGSGETTPQAGFYPTLYDPMRDEPTTYPYSSPMTARKIGYSIDDVRSKIIVEYKNSTTGARGKVSAENDSARKDYGIKLPDTSERKHREMRVSLPNDSIIDTESEAVTLADNALHDSSSPPSNAKIEMDYIWPEPQLHDLIEYTYEDYNIKVGTGSVEWSWSADGNQRGKTTIKGSIEKVIGTHLFWQGFELSEEERAKQRRDHLEGQIEQLPDARILHENDWTYQSEDGSTQAAIDITWERVRAWWYGETWIWLKDNDADGQWQFEKKSRGGNSTVITGLPTQHNFGLRIKHIPEAGITPQGER